MGDIYIYIHMGIMEKKMETTYYNGVSDRDYSRDPNIKGPKR